MRLESARLKNFRSCTATTIGFAEHLTLLVGENDAGKSNVIDGLRAATHPASGRITLWFDAERDLSYGIPRDESIEIERVYGDLTDQEDAFYTPALVDADRKLVHTTVFNTDQQIPRRYRLKHNVGKARVPDPEPENRERIAHVYLPPLRDAAAALDSSGGNRMAEVFRMIATKDEIKAFEEMANASLGKLADDPTARKVVKGVQDHLTSVTRPVRHRIVDLKHRQQRLRALARSLRLHMAAKGLTPSDLLGSGLGYANLLFIATVVLELEKSSDFDLLLLLVEEPEAHLHPQLQSVLLSYLSEQAFRSAQHEPHGEDLPGGRIQVIATSHSPHLASSVSTSNVVVMRSQDRATDRSKGEESGETPLDQKTPRFTESIAIALGGLPLTDSERRKIDRYLDATRGSLLFARQVVLVEGIAEAMLLRTLAEQLVFPESLDGDADEGFANKQLREQFRAISVLGIAGVDFVPYLSVLLPKEGALVDRVVVVTDGDDGAGAKRKSDIEEKFADFVAAGCLSVVVGESTLEAELFAPPANEPLLRKAFETQHPRSLKKWDELISVEDAPARRARAFSAALKEKKLDLAKGDFAHLVSELITREGLEGKFEIPAYLKAAILAVVIPPATDVEEINAPA